MQLAAITKARTLAFIEIDELNLEGKVRFADIVQPLVEQFAFTSYPTKPTDFDLKEQGVDFMQGRVGDIVIDDLKIYDGVIYVETLSSTLDSQKALLHILEWGAANLGLTYQAGMIRRWAYVSNIVFYTDFPILKAMSSPIANLAEKTSAFMEDLWGGLRYEPLSFSIGHDPTSRKHGIAELSIQHRVNTQTRENKYFSIAPLPTELHIQYLTEFEQDIRAGRP